MLALAGGDSRIEISTLTKDQKAPHTAKVNELRNMDNFGVVEVEERPQSQQVLPTSWVSKQRLDGSFKVGLVARGFEQTESSDTFFTLERQNSRLCAHFSRLQQFTETQLFLEIVTVHFTNLPMPIESEPVYVEPAPEAQSDSSKVWLCKKFFRDSRSLLRPGVFTKATT